MTIETSMKADAAELNSVLKLVLELLEPEAQLGVHFKLNIDPHPLLINAEADQVFWAAFHLIRYLLKYRAIAGAGSNTIVISTGCDSKCVYFEISGQYDTAFNLVPEIEGGALALQMKSAERKHFESEYFRLQNWIEKLSGRFICNVIDTHKGDYCFRVELPLAIKHSSNYGDEYIKANT